MLCWRVTYVSLDAESSHIYSRVSLLFTANRVPVFPRKRPGISLTPDDLKNDGRRSNRTAIGVN